MTICAGSADLLAMFIFGAHADLCWSTSIRGIIYHLNQDQVITVQPRPAKKHKWPLNTGSDHRSDLAELDFSFPVILPLKDQSDFISQ